MEKQFILLQKPQPQHNLDILSKLVSKIDRQVANISVPDAIDGVRQALEMQIQDLKADISRLPTDDDLVVPRLEALQNRIDRLSNIVEQRTQLSVSLGERYGDAILKHSNDIGELQTQIRILDHKLKKLVLFDE